MKSKISRFLTTLVALFAMTTGAWADEWTNIVVNSDMEGTDVSCFYVYEQGKDGMNLASITPGIGKDGSRAIKLQSSDNEPNSGDTQFDIRLPYVLPAGTQYKLSFDYKTNKAGEFGFQIANEPGQNVFWTLGGYPAPGISTDESNVNKWQHYEAEHTVPADCDGTTKIEQGDWLMKFRTIYINLSGNNVATEFVFDNVKVEILSDVLAGLTPEPAPASPAGTALTPDATRKVWTLDAMPAGNVELQVAYFPGKLTLAQADGGTIAVDGLSLGGDAPTLPTGFDTDGTNIYVADGTAFKINVTPAEGFRLKSLTFGTTDITADVKDGIATVTMPTGNADQTLTATFSDEFDLTFQAANTNTIEQGMATVTVGDGTTQTAATLTDGKLSVKAGQTVTLTAKQGYKFRDVSAKKAGGLLTLSVGDATITYKDGETWAEAIANHPTENAGWVNNGYIYYNGLVLTVGYNPNVADQAIDPSKNYSLLTL